MRNIIVFVKRLKCLKHQSFNWLVLFSWGNGGGGMYPVSDAFMRAVRSNTRKYFWTGTIVIKGGIDYSGDL